MYELIATVIISHVAILQSITLARWLIYRNSVQNPADNIYCNFVTKEILSMQTKEEHIGPKLRDSMIVRGRPSVLTEDDSNLVHLIK